MADPVLENQNTPIPVQPAAAPSQSIPDDYEELKAFRAQFEPGLRAIAPYWDEYVKPIIEDEQEREFLKTARASRQQFIDSQKPKLSPEMQLVRDEFESKLTPIVEYVQSERQQREDASKASVAAAEQANIAYAQRLIAERPDLAEENYWGMHSLAALAARDKISLEDSWKRYSSRFSGPTPKREPPTSLRSGEAAPGVPGPSQEPRITNKRGIVSRLAQNLRAAGVKG